MQTGIGLRKELSIYGDDYATIEDNRVRYYIHIVDVAKELVVVVQRLINGMNLEQV
jgi:UDP-glucose 4-epimerase